MRFENRANIELLPDVRRKNGQRRERTMRDRLIELIGNFPTYGGTLKEKWWGEAVERLADHLLSEGGIVPPCKVGQTVYSVEKSISQVFVGEVYEVFSNKYGTVLRLSRKGYYSFSFTADALGKTVFLTKEEAESALERSENGK